MARPSKTAAIDYTAAHDLTHGLLERAACPDGVAFVLLRDSDKKGLRLRPDFTLTDEEMNTYACPWHNNITTAICSFRTAKALRANPGSRFAINTFRWRNSTEFQWQSQQLMDLGLMEPGQWF